MFTRRFLVILMCAVSVHAIPVPDETEQQNTSLQIGFFERCIEDLGCFDNGVPFYHPVHRPVSLLPFKRLNTKFLLFDRQNRSRVVALEPNRESLWDSDFDPYLDTKFLIHGYTSDLREGDWKYRLKDALLDFERYNVIMVDWRDSNGPPYPQAVANARVVGAQIAQLIKFLEDETDILPESVHLIGHSLGSHLAGWAGERIQNLGRITGLDPAGPYFQKAEDIVRLDPSDAEFVDIIHTNGGTNFLDGLGITDPIGHLDFYPNGGIKQPGCPTATLDSGSNDTSSGTIQLGSSNSCNHARAPNLFVASITNDGQCTFEAQDCENEDACRNSQVVQTAVMGYHASKIPDLEPGHKFYLSTTGRPPYCNTHGGTP